MISEAAVHEAVKTSRALGDAEPITSRHLWERVANDMSDKPYKPLALDLLREMRRDYEKTVDLFTRFDQRLEAQAMLGRDHRQEIRNYLRAEAVKRSLNTQIDALAEAIDRNANAVAGVARSVIDHLAELKARLEESQHRIEDAAAAHPNLPVAPAPRPGLRPGF
jgi:hypothetical protein